MKLSVPPKFINTCQILFFRWNLCFQYCCTLHSNKYPKYWTKLNKEVKEHDFKLYRNPIIWMSDSQYNTTITRNNNINNTNINNNNNYYYYFWDFCKPHTYKRTCRRNRFCGNEIFREKDGIHKFLYLFFYCKFTRMFQFRSKYSLEICVRPEKLWGDFLT